jgi:hypothetical protein
MRYTVQAKYKQLADAVFLYVAVDGFDRGIQSIDADTWATGSTDQACAVVREMVGVDTVTVDKISGLWPNLRIEMHT